MPDLVCRIM